MASAKKEKYINPICLEIQKIDFGESFTLIPNSWYNYIQTESRGSLRPELLAISILADIIYWYRPNVIKTKGNKSKSESIEVYTQKFKGDKLQRSYQDYVVRFHISKRMAKRSIDFLVKSGFITREFKTKVIYGILCTNIMYLEPVPEKIKEITTSTNDLNKYIHPNTYIQKYLSAISDYNKLKNKNKLWELITCATEIDTVAAHIKNMKYKDFLQSLYWKAVSYHVISKSNFVCMNCGATNNLVAHHLTYDNHGYEHLYWEKDLICICDVCHKKIHNIKA